MRYLSSLVVICTVAFSIPAWRSFAQGRAGEGTVVATVGRDKLTASELETLISGRLGKLRTEEYRIRRGGAEEWIANRLLARAAKVRNVSVDDLLRSEVDQRVTELTVAEARAILEHTRGRGMPTSDPDTMVASIQRDMRARRSAVRKQQFLWELRQGEKIKMFLVQPRVTVSAADRPSKGPATAPVTIVLFSDYECPYCSQFNQILDSVLQKFGADIRLVHRHFPLDIHKNATKAAEAADCAGEQGRFWEMHDALYRSGRLTVADLKQHAAGLKLDEGRFGECLDSGRLAHLWKSDKTAGESYGVSGTPTIFVNGRMLPGVPTPEALMTVVDEELSLVRPAGRDKSVVVK
jgi:protein-disulfide isomerase